jgi:hypothetical protein
MSFAATSRRIEQERRAKFCGTASIRVSSLNFDDLDGDGDRKSLTVSVEPLKRMFREERGCRQDDSRHHAKAIISRDVLATALSHTGLQSGALLSDTLPYPKLEIPSHIKIKCLQRYDRASASVEVFEGANKTWIVDLFSDGKLSTS